MITFFNTLTAATIFRKLAKKEILIFFTLYYQKLYFLIIAITKSTNDVFLGEKLPTNVYEIACIGFAI